MLENLIASRKVFIKLSPPIVADVAHILNIFYSNIPFVHV
jgi:hypothetical protein